MCDSIEVQIRSKYSVGQAFDDLIIEWVYLLMALYNEVSLYASYDCSGHTGRTSFVYFFVAVYIYRYIWMSISLVYKYYLRARVDTFIFLDSILAISSLTI